MKIQITIEMISTLAGLLYFATLFGFFHKRAIFQFQLLVSFMMMMCLGLLLQWYIQLFSFRSRIKKIHASIK